MRRMRNSNKSDFELFSQDFVRAYWQAVESGDFPMPPNEPVKESIEELLSAISYATEVEPSSARAEPLCKLLMTHKLGDWWHFTFRGAANGWSLIGCTARSDDDSNPHDLLDAVYSPYFEPFLRHVTNVANADHRI